MCHERGAGESLHIMQLPWSITPYIEGTILEG